LFAARDALLDRRASRQKGTGNLLRPEPAQNVEHQRDLHFFLETRIAAREHHAQLFVADDLRGEGFVDDGSERPLALEQSRELGCEMRRGALAANDVEGAILCGGHEPRGWIVRHAAHLPDLERATEGILHHVFGQRQVVHAEDAGERGDHARGFAAEEVLVELHVGS